jgi:hypothetical protein
MKCDILFSTTLTLAAAAPLLQERHSMAARDIPNYPGIQFGADGKLSITVFSDLHFGERESLSFSFFALILLIMTSLG